MAKPSSSTPSGPQPMPTITWSTPDTFTYDGGYHELTVSGYPTGSQIIYTGGETNSNNAKTAGIYTIKAVITADGYIPWDGTHILTINQATFSTFTIDDSTIPANLTPGYSATDWTQTVSTSPTPDSVTYTLTNVASGLNGKLSVDTSGSSTSGIKLDLAVGVLTGTYSYTIHGVAHKTGYTDATYDKVCSLKINAANKIKLANGNTYTIDVSYNNFLTNRTNSGTFDFRDTSGVDQTITKTDIKEIHLTDLPQITTAPDSYLANMCYKMTNLTVADIQIPNTITTVGGNFCRNMFDNCSSLTSLPSNFNLPSGITSINGYNFCLYMFYNCTSLTSLPSGFNIPQGITGFSQPNFCREMFELCTSLTTVPSGFKIPSGITSAGSYFCEYMFNSCTSLTSLPSSFSFPQTLTSIDEYFAAYMFVDCTSLRNDSGNLLTIHLPPDTSGTASNYCRLMFYGGITSNPDTPSPDTDVTVNKT